MLWHGITYHYGLKKMWQRHIFNWGKDTFNRGKGTFLNCGKRLFVYIRQHHCTSKSLLPIMHCSVMSWSGAPASAAPPSTGCGNSIGSCNLNSRLLARPAFCLLRCLGPRFGRGGHLWPFKFLCLPGPRTQTLPLFTGTPYRQLAVGSGNNLGSVSRIATIFGFIIGVRGAEVLLFTRS